MKISELLQNPERTLRRNLTVNQTRPYPTFLYKYRRGDEQYLRSLVVDNTLFLSSRTSFNDPMDVSFTVSPSPTAELRREYLLRISEGHSEGRQQLFEKVNTAEEEVKIRKKMLAELADKTGVFSFAETPRNLLMWAHYANNHSGICLQYYIPASFDFSRLLLPVNYVQDLVEITPQNQKKSIIAAFTSKSADWSYEEEWRVVQPNAAGQKIQLPPEMLVGVIYGARCTQEVKENVRRLIDERMAQGQPSLFEYQARLSAAYYHVGIFPNTAGESSWKGRRVLLRPTIAKREQVPLDLRTGSPGAVEKYL